MLILLLLSPARADDAAATDETAEEPAAREESAEERPVDAPPVASEWQELTVPADFASALDTVATDADTLAADDLTRVEDLVPGALRPATPRARLRGRFTIRPWLGAEVLQTAAVDGGWGLAAGGSLGHQWWSLRESTVRPVGQTRLVAALPFAGAHGWLTSLDATAGAWAGPVGLLGGLALRAESVVVPEGAALHPALGVGPRLHLAAKTGPLTPWVAASPLWLVAGERPALDAPWDELELSAGLELDGRPFALRLSGSRLDTAQGVAWGASLGLALRLL